MIFRTGFNSTALMGATWDDETEALTVTFKSGDTYDFEGVPREVWLQFRDSQSPGTFYHRMIKGVY